MIARAPETGRELMPLINALNTPLIDIGVLVASAENLLENLEYREQDQRTIDSLYTFMRHVQMSVREITAVKDEIENLPRRGAA